MIVAMTILNREFFVPLTTKLEAVAAYLDDLAGEDGESETREALVEVTEVLSALRMLRDAELAVDTRPGAAPSTVFPIPGTLTSGTIRTPDGSNQ